MNENQRAEQLLRAIFLRPDLTPEGREQFIQEMMAGKTELTITWDDICTMAEVTTAQPAPAQGEPDFLNMPIPFCEPCKAGRYAECVYAIPCTLPVK